MELFNCGIIVATGYISSIFCCVMRLCCNKNVQNDIPEHIKKETCTICFEPECNTETPCGHAFHYECLKSWFIEEGTCPNCRKEIDVIIMYEEL